MSWIEVKATFEHAPEDWSPLVDLMGRHGCENTLQTDRPPALVACVAAVEGADELVERLRSDLLRAGAHSVESRGLPDENWEQLWRQHFKPRRIGQSLVIRPTWEDYAVRPGDLEIVLDPGQAFGTGDHATTRMMLEQMEAAGLQDLVVADVGCGSGILSIAAVLLGAGRVAAVDIEPISVAVAKENMAMNRVEFVAVAGEGIAALDVLQEGAPPYYDVVLSNIISATLIAIAHQVAARVRPGGRWIVSGIIHPNWEDVRNAAEREGFELVSQSQENEWIAATFRLS
jgi:ribosomal protein L11 methyltransferase